MFEIINFKNVIIIKLKLLVNIGIKKDNVKEKKRRKFFENFEYLEFIMVFFLNNLQIKKRNIKIFILIFVMKLNKKVL